MSTTTGQGRSNGRLDREAYFNAAFRILAARGFIDVTVDNLSAELGATKGSFYHHFAGVPEFVEALMATWEQTMNEFMESFETMDPLTAIERTLAVQSAWPWQAEGALLAWATCNRTVAETLARRDVVWDRATRAWLGQFLDDPERCRVLSQLMRAAALGLMVSQRPRDPALVQAVSTEILGVNVGLKFLPDGSVRLPDRAV